MPEPINPQAISIIDQIRTAFAGVPRGEITLHEAEVLDHRGSDREREEARKHDVEKNWEEVPDHDIANCPWGISHLDPVSWRYYLPAKMIWILKHDMSGSLIGMFTLFALRKGDSAELFDYKLARFRTLNFEQSNAVCRFLWYFVEYEEGDTTACVALDEYWGQYCNC